MNWFNLWVIDWWGCFLFWTLIVSLVGAGVALVRLSHEEFFMKEPKNLKKFNRNSIILLSICIAAWVFLIFAPSTGTLIYWLGMDQDQVWRILHPYRF